VKLGAINSINWARVLAQITYYFYSWLRVTDNNDGTDPAPKLNYAVPTGNFGDILAGYYAKKMGLPIDKLVICANENDVLHRFLETGTYKKTPAFLTIAPSMDISVSSNFERYMFYLAGSNAKLLAAWMDQFETTGELTVPKDVLALARSEFVSYRSGRGDIINIMREVYDKEGYLVCPHTATAVVAVKALKLPADRTVCLATAHPAKFEEAVNLALTNGRKIPARPPQLQELFALRVRTYSVPNALKDVQTFVRSKLGRAVSSRSSGFASYFNLATLSTAAVVGAAAYFIFISASKRR
jgi:threonine synthase